MFFVLTLESCFVPNDLTAFCIIRKCDLTRELVIRQVQLLDPAEHAQLHRDRAWRKKKNEKSERVRMRERDREGQRDSEWERGGQREKRERETGRESEREREREEGGKREKEREVGGTKREK